MFRQSLPIRLDRPGPVLALLCVLLLPQATLAQAGSRPATRFESVASLHDTGAGSGQVPAAASAGARVPEGVWMLPAGSPWLLWVELETGTLNVLERGPDGGFVLRRTLPVSLGKQGIGKAREGDRKTPVGSYRITSFLTDAGLDDYYGIGAYPLNYPNALDLRHGRTGHGIWLHGLPKGVAERPLLDSDGCVVIDNENLRELAPLVTAGRTPIVLSPGPLRWVALKEQARRRQALEQALEGWRQAWERRDNDSYLGYYAKDFSDLSRNKASWAQYKRRVNDGKDYIRVRLSELSMLVDPAETDLVTVRYFQDYASSNYTWRGWKEQLWRNQGTRWEIIYEGN